MPGRLAAIEARYSRHDIFKGKDIMSTHDMDKARSTYDSFMGSLKWIVPVIAVITLFVVSLIAP